MLLSIIIILLGFAWLGYETDFMRVRLESSKYQWQQLAIKEYRTSKVNANTETEAPEETTPLKPVEFTPLDMPDFTGTLNIVCKRGIA